MVMMLLSAHTDDLKAGHNLVKFYKLLYYIISCSSFCSQLII